MADPKFSNCDKCKCAQREVGKRRRVYPNLVANRGMKQADADREIAIMEAIAFEYAEKAHADDVAGRLL